MSLDSILNVIVPTGIFIAIIIFIYSKAQKPIDKFFGKIKDWITQTKPEIDVDVEDYIIGYRKSDY